MSKNILVTTDVFAAIWAARKQGEDSEDAILRRILECESSSDDLEQSGTNSIDGVYEYRTKLNFKRGFKIFRNYKGKLYKAIAIDGAWQREDTQGRYTTLNQLNSSNVAGNENVWHRNWKYREENETICSLKYMRDHQKKAK